ncbi:MAG: hypothetical protein COA78_05495 [Blastopirellula sp.]|nr:MAG: hypothetical protein COA78_05495 [Blastopirellula sp.]
MWMAYSMTTRALIWLSVVAMPFQVLSASTCGCSDSNSCCEQADQATCCCSDSADREGRYCSKLNQMSTDLCCFSLHQGNMTDTNKVEKSCLHDCGLTCQCGMANYPTPLAIPKETNSTEKHIKAFSFLVCLPSDSQAQVKQPYNVASFCWDALAATDRCISLCRFKL